MVGAAGLIVLFMFRQEFKSKTAKNSITTRNNLRYYATFCKTPPVATAYPNVLMICACSSVSSSIIRSGAFCFCRHIRPECKRACSPLPQLPTSECRFFHFEIYQPQTTQCIMYMVPRAGSLHGRITTEEAILRLQVF